MITVVGWPRSGTHWIKAMLEYALGEELAHAHPFQKVIGEQYVLIIRDPRDAFASHWRLYQGNYPDKTTEIGFVSSFLKGQGPNQHSWNTGWVPYVRSLLEWNKHYPHCAPLVYYEWLYAAPGKTLTRVLADIGRHRVLRRHTARAAWLTQRRRCDPSGLPVDKDMGRPGKWKAQLHRSTIRILLAYCGNMMTELGYLN